MNTLEILRESATKNIPVQAHVFLLNGETRSRNGVVAAVNTEYVIIKDFVKGFRTTPLALIHDVKLVRGNIFQRIWRALTA